VNEDIARAMPLRDFFNLMAVKLNPQKAKNVRFKINFELTDSREKVAVIINNQVENHRVNSWSENADLTVSLSRITLNDIAYGRISTDQAVVREAVSITGSVERFKAYWAMHDQFDLWFNIIEP